MTVWALIAPLLMTLPRPLAVLCLLSTVLCVSSSALELAPPFTDHAVLQRDVAVPVWGWDDQPGATVTVTFAGQTKTTLVNQSGLWRVDLDPLQGTATGSDLVVSSSYGGKQVTFIRQDVVVGEVWIASGQSNMEWGMNATRGYEDEKAKAPNPLIRDLRVSHTGADLPAGRVPNTGWRVAAPDTIGSFSGVGYFFAQSIAEKLQLPVGIIHSSWGGTAIESWIPEPALRTSRGWKSLNAKWQDAMKRWPQAYADQPGLEAAWQKAQEEFRTKGTPVTMSWPRPPMGPGSGFAPARLFNGMISPFVPYALRGALWYQGESNVGRHVEYAELLPLMIQSWRGAWPQGDFPFLVVQLPNYTDNGKATGRAWAQLREAQASAQHVPAVGVAVIIDGDEPDDLHPRNKRPVGERLALIARHRVYNERTLAWSGPVLQDFVREGAALRVRFSYADGLKSRTAEVTGFEIAGADKVFQPATAKIEGSSVVVSSAAVAEPVAVRYAYTNAPAASLANAAGLPAAPFRTDDW
jgi:sialate O-acetylesterase